MSSIIVDCSVTMAWLFPDEATPESEESLRIAITDGLLVPEIWPLEVANVLVMCERKARINRQQSNQFVARLRSLDLEIDLLGITEIFDKCIELSRDHGLTVYDATYLELALRSKLTLHSKDRDLILAAQSAGASVVEIK
jgi:predicted nucleic acid-binding protein